MERKSLYLFFLSITAIFTYCLGMTDTHILPKWLYTLGAVAVVGIVEGFALWFKKQRSPREKALLAIVASLCSIQAVYAITQALGLCPSRFSYQVIGSFENPAGLVSCLCVGVPCCIYLFCVSEQKWMKWGAAVMAVVISVAIVLSESRAGILAGICVPVAWWLFTVVKKRWLRVVFVGLGMVLLCLMYIAKKDSADGRLLMWHCGWEMIKDKPLFGHGIGGVEAHYMDYQAEWLDRHPDSSFSFLADNVKSVFNEYLSIGIRFGVIGWMVLTGWVWLLVHGYRRYPTEEGRWAMMSLAAIGVLACFSYPLTYPFTWVVLFLDSYILIRRTCPLSVWKGRKVRVITASLLFASSSLLLYGVSRRTYAEWKWGQLADKASRGEDVFSDYKSLLPILGNEPYFLYNYAAELYYAGQYEKALLVARRCRKYWADYDLELLQGDLLDKQNKPEEAEWHFLLASRMCPVRFVPLYKLYEVYQKTGDGQKARQMGETILEKPVKVESVIVNSIKARVQGDLKKR